MIQTFIIHCEYAKYRKIIFDLKHILDTLKSNILAFKIILLIFDFVFLFFKFDPRCNFSRFGESIATQDRDTCAVSSVVSATMRTMHLCMRRAAKPNLRPSLLRQNASSQFLRVRMSYFLLPNNKRSKGTEGLSTFHRNLLKNWPLRLINA